MTPENRAGKRRQKRRKTPQERRFTADNSNRREVELVPRSLPPPALPPGMKGGPASSMARIFGPKTAEAAKTTGDVAFASGGADASASVTSVPLPIKSK